MITELTVYTDAARVVDPGVAVDVSGEYFLVEAAEDEIQVLYRSEPISNLNDRTGTLIIKAGFRRSHLKCLFAVATALLRLREKLEQTDMLHFKKVRQFNESSKKDVFVRSVIANLAGNISSSRKGRARFTTLDFASPLKVLERTSSSPVFEAVSWLSVVERFAICAYALGNGHSKVAVPFQYGKRLLGDLSALGATLVLPHGKWDAANASPKSRRIRVPLLGSLRSSRRQSDRELNLVPEKLLQLSAESLPISPEIRQLADDFKIKPADVCEFIDRLVALEIKGSRQSWYWRKSINDVAVLFGVLGEGLEQAAFDAAGKSVSFRFADGEHFSFNDGLYTFNRKGAGNQDLELRLSLFHQLYDRLVDYGFQKLEAVGGDV